MYYIGIDATGSYARIAAADERLKVIGKHTGALNNFPLSKDIRKENFTKLISELNRMTNTVISDCAGLCIGSVITDNPEKRHDLEKMLEELNYPFRFKLVNEPRLMIAAQTRGAAGIVVYSGTSSWGASCDTAERMILCGGYGHLIDDCSSGYAIGMAAVRHALLAAEFMIGKTVLTEMLKEHFKLADIHDVKNVVYGSRFNVSAIAQLSSLVASASEKGDESAVKIEEAAAQSLSRMVDSLINRSEIKEPAVCMAGNIFKNSGKIRESFAKSVHAYNKEARIELLTEKLEIGAVSLALTC